MPDSRPQTTLMLWAAFAMPLLYFGAQLLAVPFYPGYHFATDTTSMLATSVSRHPGIFNTGAIDLPPVFSPGIMSRFLADRN